MGEWSRADMLTLTAIVVPAMLVLIPGIWVLIYYQLTNHKETRNELIQILENTPVLKKYQTLVQGLLTSLQGFFASPESAHAFGKSLQLAYVYPIVFFMLAYSFFGGSHSFSGFDVFPENSDWKALFFPAITIV